MRVIAHYTMRLEELFEVAEHGLGWETYVHDTTLGARVRASLQHVHWRFWLVLLVLNIASAVFFLHFRSSI